MDKEDHVVYIHRQRTQIFLDSDSRRFANLNYGKKNINILQNSKKMEQNACISYGLYFV